MSDAEPVLDGASRLSFFLLTLIGFVLFFLLVLYGVVKDPDAFKEEAAQRAK